MSKLKLSVVLATKNEESNIGDCLKSIKSVADEIVVVDEYSTDKTRIIAKKFDSQIYKWKHKQNFHESKQKALEKASGAWILQLDADERVSKSLAKEIRNVIELSDDEIRERKPENRKKWRLFQKHQHLIEQREGSLGQKTGEVVAFFVPRVNYFLGKPLKYAGAYPDGVIRLVKKGKARFPAKSVHELMEIDGEVAWLFNDLEHRDSPDLKRYLDRTNRYTDLSTDQFKEEGEGISYLKLFYYSFVKPGTVFINLYFRHKGFLDGMRGFVWSFFSALHFPIAYFKYWVSKKT